MISCVFLGSYMAMPQSLQLQGCHISSRTPLCWRFV